MSNSLHTTPVDLQECDHEAHRTAVHTWAGIAEFVSAPQKQDGLHVIGTGNGTHLDVFTSGDPFRPTSKPVLVVFNGAVSKRQGRVPPFLSGRGIGQATGWPFIAISDPSVALNDDVSIAWYAGSRFQNVQRDMLEILRPVAQAQKNLWLMGGSAGGFAALVLGHMLGSAASVFVWNAQTDLLEYSPGYVKNYLKNAFPEIRGRMEQGDWKKHARLALRRYNLVHSVMETFLPSQRPRRLLFLQNHNDWHVIAHCVPYLTTFGYRRAGDGLYAQDEDHVVWLPEIGNGHPAPPKDAVVQILRTITASAWSQLESVELLEGIGIFSANGRSPLTRPRDLTGWGKRITDRIRFSSARGQAEVHLVDLPPHFGGISAEFETHLAGKTIHRQPYSAQSLAYTVPDSADAESKVHITVRDGFGNVLKSEALPVSSPTTTSSDEVLSA